MSPIDEVPVPQEPRVFPGRLVGVLVLSGWTLVAAVTAGLWLAGGWWMVAIGWLLLIAAVGFVIGAGIR